VCTVYTSSAIPGVAPSAIHTAARISIRRVTAPFSGAAP
jgi:hypothetical protein